MSTETGEATDADGPHTRRPGRPRSISDEAIYLAAVGVLAEHGSNGLTLARVAEALSVTPAAVRQRFGSKRGLLLDMARRRTSGVEAGFALAREKHASRLQALEAALLTRIEGLEQPVRLANAISAYVDNAADDELRALFDAELTEMEGSVGRMLDEAAEAGEIDRATPELASAVFAAFEGALTIWAIAPRGRVEDRVHEALQVVLGRKFPAIG
jgi:AcrR family transcriptional regulator